MQIKLANPRGFCAGVERAIGIVNHALEQYGPPVYVRHEIIHNRTVVDGLRARGVVFVDRLDEVPGDAVVIFSAHGVSKMVTEEAIERGLRFIDATCPLVVKVHHQVAEYSRKGYEIIMVGQAGHPEVEGTMGQVDTGEASKIHLVENVEDVARLQINKYEKLMFVTQTTLAMDDVRDIIQALGARFPSLAASGQDDICYATQNRQEAVRALAGQCDVVLVVGSRHSSNSNSLRRLAEKCGKPAYLIDDPQDLERDWLENKACIGITAGASAPEPLVQSIIARLKTWGATNIQEEAGRHEHVAFGVLGIFPPKKT